VFIDLSQREAPLMGWSRHSSRMLVRRGLAVVVLLWEWWWWIRWSRKDLRRVASVCSFSRRRISKLPSLKDVCDWLLLT